METLFRGKLKTDNGNLKKGDWVTGDYVRLKDGNHTIHCIYGKGEVDADTVGQFTGKYDSKGTNIFTSDIVRIDYGIGYGGLKGNPSEFAVIVFKDGCFCMKIFKFVDGTLDQRCAIGKKYFFQYGLRITVVGNVYDNPELLEKGAASDA